MNESLKLEHIQISRGHVPIIRGIDLTISPGELCALLGANGSGKTTLLHGICGLLPMSGTCLAGGQDCAGLHERQRARLMSFLPQVSALGGGRSVLDVVLMGFNAQLGLFQSPTAAHRAAALQALEQVGCAALSHRDFGALSQGQRQLVMLARAKVQDAPVMLMDEPDSALDLLNRHMVLAQVRDTIHQEGRAGLIAMHDPNFALAYCDRLLLLSDGHIQAQLEPASATPDEIVTALSLLYGPMDLIPRPGGLLVWKQERPT